MGDNAEEMGEKDAIRAEQTPRKMEKQNFIHKLKCSKLLRGKKKRFLLII